jgi:hypothetical protein
MPGSQATTRPRQRRGGAPIPFLPRRISLESLPLCVPRILTPDGRTLTGCGER